MPQRKSAQKEQRKNVRRKQYNNWFKNRIRRAVKELKKAVEKGNSPEANEKLNLVYSLLDKAATKRIIHPNKASRKKSCFSRLIKA